MRRRPGMGVGRPAARRAVRRRRRRRMLLVGGLVAFGTYKMTSRDADRIKEHTGVDPEELTDEELAQAMDELDIEQQVLTDEDREEASAAPAAPAPAEASGGASDLEQLEKLAQLRDAGVLTDEEFEAKKRQILGL